MRTWVSQCQNVSTLDFTGAKTDGSGGDNWSYKSCKAAVKSSPTNKPTSNFFTGRMPFQPTVSKHWRETHAINHHMQKHKCPLGFCFTGQWVHVKTSFKQQIQLQTEKQPPRLLLVTKLNSKISKSNGHRCLFSQRCALLFSRTWIWQRVKWEFTT